MTITNAPADAPTDRGPITVAVHDSRHHARRDSARSAPDATSFVTRPAAGGATATAAAMSYAGRTIRQFVRTPQLIVLGAAVSTMFLLIFRYVFGGAIGTGTVSYADFLIPGLAAAGAFFSGTGAAVGVATDAETGMFDRLRSLPISRTSVLAGRSMADTALAAWSLFVTVAVGLAVGFRFHGSARDALLAAVLCIVFSSAFTWPFIWMGLVAGNAQAANGMTFMAFPLVFVSSAYVPVASMPGWMQAVAGNQPVTMMINSVRALSLGDRAGTVLEHSAAWYTVRALIWSVAIVAVFAPLARRRFSRH